MIVAVPKENFPGELRVALVPQEVTALLKRKIQVVIEAGAGLAAGYPDAAYAEKGASLVNSRAELFKTADVIVQVRAYGSNPSAGKSDLEFLRKGQVVLGFCDPLSNLTQVNELRERGISVLAMELVPRITRAQSMDALSSMANIAGYKSVLLAGMHLPKIFPMMITAAGTIAPTKVLVLGVGVAGLQAIATAKRLGAVVEAYDVRPEVKEQVLSVGGKFVELKLDNSNAGGQGGYAKEQSAEFLAQQRALLAHHVQLNDVVITTAAIPGKRAPVLVTAEMVRGMKPGSVIVDLAAETGGNCELTKAGETTVVNNVTIVGPSNLPATVPFHASQLYARNIATVLSHISTLEGALKLDTQDEITRDMMACHQGEIVSPRVAAVMGK